MLRLPLKSRIAMWSVRANVRCGLMRIGGAKRRPLVSSEPTKTHDKSDSILVERSHEHMLELRTVTPSMSGEGERCARKKDGASKKSELRRKRFGERKPNG
jgi:hypothetical protein